MYVMSQSGTEIVQIIDAEWMSPQSSPDFVDQEGNTIPNSSNSYRVWVQRGALGSQIFGHDAETTGSTLNDTGIFAPTIKFFHYKDYPGMHTEDLTK